MRSPTGMAWLGVASGLALAMVVTGCTDGQGRAGTLPSRTSTPTATSASPSPTPTTPEAEIEAFVRAFFAEVTRASQTLDTAKLEVMTTEQCECAAYAETFNKAKQQGARYIGANWTVTSVEVLDVNKSVGLARVTYVAAPYRIVDSDGKILEQVKKRRWRDEYSLIRNGNRWVIARIFDAGGK